MDTDFLSVLLVCSRRKGGGPYAIVVREASARDPRIAAESLE
jgi:hypothetical protein